MVAVAVCRHGRPPLPIVKRVGSCRVAGQHDLGVPSYDCFDVDRGREFFEFRKNIATATQLEQFADEMFAVDRVKRSP